MLVTTFPAASYTRWVRWRNGSFSFVFRLNLSYSYVHSLPSGSLTCTRRPSLSYVFSVTSPVASIFFWTFPQVTLTTDVVWFPFESTTAVRSPRALYRNFVVKPNGFVWLPTQSFAL